MDEIKETISTEKLRKDSIRGFMWRAIQSISAQLISFIIQIVLARLLLPSDFGLIALTNVFITISNVFVQTGFCSALVQKKEIDELDKSSMFYLSIVMGVVLYLIIFFIAPLVANFYETEELTMILRIQSISLIFVSLSSVSVALITRALQFKKSMIVSVIGYIIQGVIGITMALNGFGVWALVWSIVAYNIIYSLGILIVCKWYPKLLFSFKRAKIMIIFSSKVLAVSLLNAVSNSVASLIIGKVYDKDSLGYYSKGIQFPSTIMNGLDSSMSTVVFSTLSRIQDDNERLVRVLRRAIKTSLTVVVPMMCGLAAVATPLVATLLGENWLEAAPFVMIYSFICLFWPLASKGQALNSIGKSGITLIINIISQFLSVIFMLLSIKIGLLFFVSTSLIVSAVNFIIYTYVSKKYLGYKVKDQILDILPIYIMGFIMFGAVYGLGYALEYILPESYRQLIKLIIMIPVGVVIYIGGSFLFKLEGFMYIINYVKRIFKKEKEIKPNRFRKG